jgi:hypothetical protein
LLSQELGLSLGKTYYLLNALLGKGLIKTRNFKRRDHKLAYAYLHLDRLAREAAPDLRLPGAQGRRVATIAALQVEMGRDKAIGTATSQ